MGKLMEAAMRRYEIADDQWNRIQDLLPGKPGDPGVTAQDNRLFINAVLWIARTGAPWEDLPERFGKANSVFRRFSRWAKKGVWQRVFRALQDPDLEQLFLDSSVIRAHQHAAGKKGVRTAKPSAAPVGDSAANCTWPSMRWATPWSWC
jgi:transposase